MTTDTPRTDAAQLWHFDEPVVPKEFAQQLERELAHSLENQVKAQAEVARLKKLCEMALESAEDAVEERDIKRRIADDICSLRKDLNK